MQKQEDRTLAANSNSSPANLPGNKRTVHSWRRCPAPALWAIVTTIVIAVGVGPFVGSCAPTLPSPSDVLLGSINPMPKLTVTSPSEQIRIIRGDPLTIRWQATGVQDLPNTRVSLHLDQGEELSGDSILIAEDLEPADVLAETQERVRTVFQSP